MNYLVTGCGGFIGFHVAKHLLERGERVLGIGHESDRIQMLSGNFEYLGSDLNELNTTYQSVDRIMHFAGLSGERQCAKDPVSCIDSQISGFISVLNYAIEQEARVIYASSASVLLRESKSVYSASKRACEELARLSSRVCAVGLRLGTVYGIWGHPDMVIGRFVKNVLDKKQILVFGTNKMTRDYVNISDVIQAIDLIEQSGSRSTYCVGTGIQTGIVDLINIIEDTTGEHAISERCSDSNIYRGSLELNIEPLRKLGYNPKVTLEEGIKEYVEWYKEHVGIL